MTAEGNDRFPAMRTRSIKQLINVYSVEKPNVVIIGAKGSGKTYLYREILRREYWETFVSDMGGEKYDKKTIVVPLLATQSIARMVDILTKGIEHYNDLLGENSIDEAFYLNNGIRAKEMLRKDHSSSEWLDFWKNIMLPDTMKTLGELDQLCNEKGKRILFIVDGLEEIFIDTLEDGNARTAVRSLCQDILNEIRVMYSSLACLVFARKDIIQNSITTNTDQFASQYNGLEIIWSRTEALRLALWFVSQVSDEFKEGIGAIEETAESVIRKNLEKLWGMKLGKDSSNEAFSTNWILAALSDFNGQLQARDIIRFLEYATEDVGTAIYDDRYIMPKDIKNAIPKCSKKKIEEIEMEIAVLKPIFQKLRNADEASKKLPFSMKDFELSKNEEEILIGEGYLFNDKGNCYLPEIIRHALEFTYSKGARPKVLALMSRRS